MTVVEVVLSLTCFWLFVAVVALAYKLYDYRCAIIKLQADMTLVLNELTRPVPVKLKKVQ